MKTLFLKRVSFGLLGRLFCVEAYGADGALRWRSWSDISQPSADAYALVMRDLWQPDAIAIWITDEAEIQEGMPV